MIKRAAERPPVLSISHSQRIARDRELIALIAFDTLFLRLTAGRDTAFINDRTSEAPGEFRYLGRIGHAAFHLVKESGHETSESWIFVNPRTGHTATALDEPHFSPDSTRFVTASLD
jgi:hypothetical protein